MVNRRLKRFVLSKCNFFLKCRICWPRNLWHSKCQFKVPNIPRRINNGTKTSKSKIAPRILRTSALKLKALLSDRESIIKTSTRSMKRDSSAIDWKKNYLTIWSIGNDWILHSLDERNIYQTENKTNRKLNFKKQVALIKFHLNYSILFEIELVAFLTSLWISSFGMKHGW